MTSIQRFILVDDNEADNVYHEIMIRRAGFSGEVLSYMSGIEALDFLQSDGLELPTCIFLDVNMPLMSGFEVAEAAASMLEDRPGLVLVMLSSSSAPADIARARSTPVIRGYVTKPLSVDRIRALLEGQIPGFEGLP